MSTVYLAFLTRIKEIHSLAFLQHRPYKSRGVFFDVSRYVSTRGPILATKTWCHAQIACA